MVMETCERCKTGPWGNLTEGFCHACLPSAVRDLKLQVGALKAVAEAAKEALGCCDYGCNDFTGCDHKNCCPHDAKVIETLRAAEYTEKGIGEPPKLKANGHRVDCRCEVCF